MEKVLKMPVDEESYSENAIAERRYILKVARKRISALEPSPYDDVLWSYETAIEHAIAVVDELISSCDSGIMIVYDVETLPNGERVIHAPYRRFPDGRTEKL